MSDLMMTRFDAVTPTAERTGQRHLISLLLVMFRTYHTRQALVDLTPRQRADIGVSSSAALAEAARLPWDLGPRPGRRASVMGAMQLALERARTRRLISQLEARELRDIGVSRSDAQGEATKFFWQA